VFFSSHQIAEVERVADRVFIIDRGSLVITRTIRRSNSNHPATGFLVLLIRTTQPLKRVIGRSALIATLLLTTGALSAGASHAQSSDRNSPAAPRFDVISIKPDNNPDIKPDGGLPNKPDGGLFYETKGDVMRLLSVACNLSGYEYRAVRAQLPKWALTEGFDIQARAAGSPSVDQMRLMVRSLLADRFKFAMHYEDRQAPFFALVLARPAKLGPQIRAYRNDEESCATASPPVRIVSGGFPAMCGLPQWLEPRQTGLTRVGFRNVSMQQIAVYASGLGELDRPVLDRTGLGGTFDLVVEYDRNANSPNSEPIGPTLFEAMKDQLGLKVEPQTGPVTTFVIGHIEEPTPN
jgi:uncharacterized protein (TIGR03435 family)